MDSGTIGDYSDDLNWRGSSRWTENSKVYTRKIHKKANKTSNNSDTAATTASTAESPTAATGATSQNPTTTSAPTKVSFAAVTSAATAEVSTSSTSEYFKESKGSAAASTPPGSHAKTTLSPGNATDDDLQEPLEGLVAKDADSCQQRVQEQSLGQEQSPSLNSVAKNVDNSLQQPQLQEQLRHGEHILPVSEDNCSTQHQARQGSDSQNAEPQNIEGPPLANTSEAQNLEKSSHLQGPNEIMHKSNGMPHNLRESSPLSCEDGLPNGREGAAPQLPIENELHNDGELTPIPPEVPCGNGPANGNGVVKPLVISKVDNKVRFKLAKATSKDEIKDLRKKLEFELDQVRRLVEQLEARELQLASSNTQISNNNNLSNGSNYIGTGGGNTGGHSYPQAQHARNDLVDRRVLGMMGHEEFRPTRLARMNSDVGTIRNQEPRPYGRQLSVVVMENNHSAGEFVEKEKRTPKANQYYRNSEFLLGKDRLPPESIKRLKTNNGRKHSGETEHALRFGFGFDKSRNQAFRSCSSLLQRLMKHKHAWVFNEPVNAKALGLVDYHDIIKQPMDLGTIKTRLSQNWYKTPREFAEDVRLVFRNAMTYNPKGQDVHIMAEELSQIFEEKWETIETEYNPYWKYQMYQDAGLLTPTSRKAPPSQSHFTPASVAVSATAPIPGFVSAAVQSPAYFNGTATAQMRTSDRPKTTTTTMAIDPKAQRPHVGRTPVPKKPKAKDLNKRDMTYEEKQRLSTNLQSLPSEKLDAIVQIIKKRSTALSQHDDEIEVDIDNVDAETLWELDRFVSNYKKNLSKNKRKAELALQARSVTNQRVALMNTTTAVADVQIENGTAFEKSNATPAAEGEQQGYNARSSSSSSSSSDSGSSSSDSDSDSSSDNGSDAGHSPGT